MQALTHYMSGRDNNFNLLRMMAAVFIAFYHAHFMALGNLADEELSYLYDLSQIVLNFFFITSGFLIALSYMRRDDLFAYGAARFLRLIPGVFVLSLLTAFVMGPIVTEVSLADYFGAIDSWLYVPITTALIPDRELPGVFVSNINPVEINAALWTLRYEIACYIGLALLGIAGFLRKESWFRILIVFVLVGYIVVSYVTGLRSVNAINHMMHFGLSFFIGICFYMYREVIRLNFMILIGLVLFSLGVYFQFGRLFAEPFIICASAYLTFWLAYVPGGFVRRYNKLGDYSYGVYIYHFPIQQVLMHYADGYSPLSLFLVSLPLSLMFAVVSWTIIEKPSLSLLSNLKVPTR